MLFYGKHKLFNFFIRLPSAYRIKNPHFWDCGGDPYKNQHARDFW
jgi:hypothetical protein